MDTSTLVYASILDMQNNPQNDIWYSRVDKIKNIFGMKSSYCKTEKAGILIDKILKSKFDRFYIDRSFANIY